MKSDVVMSLNFAKLKDVINKPISGEWGDGEGNINVLRTTNFTNDGKLDLNEVVQRNIDSKKIEQKQLVFGDTIIEKSGGSPTQPVGRVVYFDEHDEVYLCNNFTSIIRPKSEIDSRYLFWFLFNNHLTKNTLKYQNKTTGIINLQLERYIEELEIPLPPLSTQKRIAEILDAADALRRKDQELLKKYDELAQAIFIDMFGDPDTNIKNWNVKSLSEICTKITDGTHQTPKYVTDGIPFLRVTDITESNQSKKYITEAEHIELIKRCKPEKGDVLYTKNGTIGVAKAVDWDYDFSIFVSLCLLKINKDLVLPNYIEIYLNTPIALKQAKKHSKTGTISNLHLVEIKQILIPVPPIKIQEEFLSRIEKIKESIKNMISPEILFNSLIQKAFKGELVK
jgi:type I restriction enzyme S subunit